MKNRTNLFGVGMLALAMCGGVALNAQDAAAPPLLPGIHGFGVPMGDHIGFMARELNLTADQKTQVKALVQAQRTTLHPLMQQMEQNHAAMLTATLGGVFDPEKIQALATQRAQIEAQLDVQHAKLQSEIYNQVLTSEQKTKADQMKQAQITRITARLATTDATTPAEQ